MNSIFNRPWFRDPERIALILGVVVLLFGEARENLHLRKLDTNWVQPAENASERWNSQLVKALSFGHLPTVVDWLWLRTLQDSELTHMSSGRHPALYFDLMLATEFDRAYFEAYLIGANILAIIRDDKTGARDLILRAQEFMRNDLPGLGTTFKEKFWKSAWEIEMSRAYLELFEFNDLPKAAEAFRAASLQPGTPAYLKHLVQRLSTREGQYSVALGLLQFMLEGPAVKEDEHARASLEHKAEMLKLSQFLYELNLSFQDFRKSRKLKGSIAFQRFFSETGRSPRDPMGGRLELSENEKITTTTPLEQVFGLGE